jgi:hypothetical protein
MWVVRADYPSAPVVEEFATEEEAGAALQRHLTNGIPVVAVEAPAPHGAAVRSRCSFCSRDRGAVGHLIAGPAGAGVAICEQCVARCNEVLAGVSSR